VDALVKLENYKGTVERCTQQQLKAATSDELSARKNLDAAIDERKNIPVEAWSREFDGTTEEAVLLWTANDGCPDAQTQPGSRHCRTLRRRSSRPAAWAASRRPSTTLSLPSLARELAKLE
jgi:hypothetical protein